MNAVLVILLLFGIAGFIAIIWLTIAGLRQRWLEYRLSKSKSWNDQRIVLKVQSRVNFTGVLFRVELIPANTNQSLPSFEAGQYLTLLIPQEGKRNKLRRSYSLASWKQKPGIYELAIKRESAGKGSSWLFDMLHEGAIIEAINPKGGFTLTSTNDEIVLVAGGIGITPLRSMLCYLKSHQDPPKVKLFFASRFAEGLCYDNEFRTLDRKCDWFEYHPILSQPVASWKGLTGRLSGSLIHEKLHNPRIAQFYFCASAEMMDSIMKGLLAEGLDRHQFHFENFAVSSGHVSEGSFTLSVDGYGDVVCDNADNIFQALENQDYPILGDCRVGQCGLCRMKLNKGQVKWLTTPEARCAPNEFLPCVCVPTDNLEISK